MATSRILVNNIAPANPNKPTEKTVTIPAKEYHKRAIRDKSTTNYFLFRRDYVLVMSHMEALLLQDLINHNDMKRRRKAGNPKKNRNVLIERDGKEYFLCTEKYLLRSLRWTKKMQETYLNKLKNRRAVKRGDEVDGQAVIEVTRHGMPTRRYIHINAVVLNRLEDDADAIKTGGGD